MRFKVLSLFLITGNLDHKCSWNLSENISFQNILFFHFTLAKMMLKNGIVSLLFPGNFL